MYKKILLSLVLLGTSVGASLSFNDMQTVTTFCQTAYADYLKTGKTTVLEETLNKLPENSRSGVLLTCYAYGEGYMDGESARNTRLKIT